MSNIAKIVNQEITDQLIRGVIPWCKPWCGPRGAYSIASGRTYSLLNQMLLGLPGAYGTFDQWDRLGGSVRKGEKGHFVVFWKMKEEKTVNENGEEKVEKYPVLRYYKVFHHSQVSGVSFDFKRDEDILPPDPNDAAEKMLWGYVDREHLGYIEDKDSNEAYYSPQKDLVVIPAREYFSSSSGLYGTIFHELGHSTGHFSRLNRPGFEHAAFGSKDYSFEELVAELTSCYLLESLGISTKDAIQNSASYIDGWIKAFQGDEKLIIRAAPAAEKAAKYIIGTYNKSE